MSLPADPWAGLAVDDFRPSARRRSRARRRSPAGSRPGYRAVRRLGVVAGAVLLLFTYSTGVSYGHWTAALYAGAQMGTGNLALSVTDPPPGFTFTCIPPVFPRHAISFVRFWDPASDPGDLKPAKPGAVKIEESGIELGDDIYSVDPPGARVGDPMTVRLDDVTVAITSWVEKPDEPGEYVGFYYAVSPEDTEVTVDVKAGQSLTRSVISGSGLWPPAGLFSAGAGTAGLSCVDDSQTGRMDFFNSGTIPAIVVLGWAYNGPPADPGTCSLFQVRIAERTSGAVLFQGSLCSLLGSPILVAPQLDPGQSLALDLTVTPGAGVENEVLLSLVSRVTWWQWTGNGWWGSTQEAFQIRVIWQTITRSVGGGTGEDTSGLTLPDEGSDSTATATTTTAPAPTTTTTTPAPTTTTTTTTEAPPAEETTTTTEAPAEGTLTLSGRVWEDLDGNGVTVVGHPQQEPGVAGVEVVLRAEDGTRLATTWTGAGGEYRFDALAPGRFRVEFRAPEGFGFRDPGVACVDPQLFADVLRVAVEQLVVDDLRLAPVPAEGEKARAKTAMFDFDEAGAGDDGGRDGSADAAMVRLPGETPEEGESTAPGGDEPPPGDLPGTPVDPNTQAAKPDEPVTPPPPPEPEPPPPGDDGAPDGSAVPPADAAVAPGEGEGAQP